MLAQFSHLGLLSHWWNAGDFQWTSCKTARLSIFIRYEILKILSSCLPPKLVSFSVQCYIWKESYTNYSTSLLRGVLWILYFWYNVLCAISHLAYIACLFNNNEIKIITNRVLNYFKSSQERLSWELNVRMRLLWVDINCFCVNSLQPLMNR